KRRCNQDFWNTVPAQVDDLGPPTRLVGWRPPKGRSESIFPKGSSGIAHRHEGVPVPCAAGNSPWNNDVGNSRAEHAKARKSGHGHPNRAKCSSMDRRVAHDQSRFHHDRLNFRHEPITLARHGLDVPGLLGVIPQRAPKLADGMLDGADIPGTAPY